MTEDVLRFVLDRARSTALSLWVDWPVAEGTLELISSYNSPIRFLEIQDDVGVDVDLGRFNGLNLNSLSEIRFLALDYNGISGILDLALSSQCKELTLHSYMSLLGLESHLIFHHKLIQQVVSFHLEFGKQMILNTFIIV
jgi:hypothetical protein